MHQDDGQGAIALLMGGPEIRFGGAKVQRLDFLTRGIQPAANLHHVRVQWFGAVDAQRKEIGPVLIADAERIGEAAGDGQDRGLALALEQGIGAHGCTHLDGFDRVPRPVGVGGEQVPDALQSGVTVAPGVFRQELVGDQAAVGTAGHDIGESAAPVDPELPAGLGVVHARCRRA